MNRVVVAVIAAFALAGCASYKWKSDVPAKLRTVCVPTFRNESDSTELGVLAARQLLREFQREGTFKIAGHDDAAVEVQGIVKYTSVGNNGSDRRFNNRLVAYSLTMVAEVSVVDRVNGRVLVDNKTYTATTSFTYGGDMLSAERSALGRVADDMAQQVVDDVLAVQW